MQSSVPSLTFTEPFSKLPGVSADARSLQDVARTPYNAAAEDTETPAYKAEVTLQGIQMLHAVMQASVMLAACICLLAHLLSFDKKRAPVSHLSAVLC